MPTTRGRPLSPLRWGKWPRFFFYKYPFFYNFCLDLANYQCRCSKWFRQRMPKLSAPQPVMSWSFANLNVLPLTYYWSGCFLTHWLGGKIGCITHQFRVPIPGKAPWYEPILEIIRGINQSTYQSSFDFISYKICHVHIARPMISGSTIFHFPYSNIIQDVARFLSGLPGTVMLVMQNALLVSSTNPSIA